MTRDEVMALSDEELRVKAAEILGFRWHKNLNGRRFMGVPDEGGCIAAESTVAVALDALRLVPDYPRDIAAAWGLWEKIPLPCGIERGYEKEYGVGPVGTHVGFGVLPLDHDEDDVYAENVWALTAPLALTRAFVFAMSNEAH